LLEAEMLMENLALHVLVGGAGDEGVVTFLFARTDIIIPNISS